MTWQLLPAVLLALFVGCWPHSTVGGEAARDEETATQGPGGRTTGIGLSRVPGASDQAEFRQANLPGDEIPHVERTVPFQVELRPEEGKTWLAHLAGGMVGPPCACASRFRTSLLTPVRLRLHVLLCTWLI